MTSHRGGNRWEICRDLPCFGKPEPKNIFGSRLGSSLGGGLGNTLGSRNVVLEVSSRRCCIRTPVLEMLYYGFGV